MLDVSKKQCGILILWLPYLLYTNLFNLLHVYLFNLLCIYLFTYLHIGDSKTQA